MVVMSFTNSYLLDGEGVYQREHSHTMHRMYRNDIA
jgi:hypothetical protein